MPDWIDRYVEITEGISSPEIFRLWSAISAVAGSLERRVWASTTIGRCYANLYIMLVAPPGVGKCLAPHERVLTFDGTSKRADEVSIGDYLIGPDSKPRTVVSTGRGFGPMYRITPNKGSSWECNGDHVLSLRKSREPNRYATKFVSVKEWLTWNNWQKSEWKLWRQGVKTFSEREEPPVDPYFIGLLIGDGSQPDFGQGIQITTVDPEIKDHIYKVAGQWNQQVSYYHPIRYGIIKTERRENPLLQAVRKLGLNVPCGEKFVPDWYKYGSLTCRAEILAGLLDTDGSYVKHANCYDFISKSEQLANDVAFLARSLDLAAYVKPCQKSCKGFTGTYYRVSISGEVDWIPCKLPRKKATARTQIKEATFTGFSVTQIEDGPWAGFEVDGDHQYLLADFTVTHNTQAITPISNIWLQQDTLCVAPESMTKAALIDTLINSRQIIMLPDNNMLEYSALQISVSELGVLVSSHDLEFLAVVNRAFDNDKVMREQRRHVNNGKELQITNPYVNILAGAQPGFLGSVLPEEAWVMGTTSRFIMVFAGEGTNFDIFGEFIDRDPMYADLAEQMKPWTKLYGQCRWEDKAVAAMKKLHIAGPNTFPPVPTAPKLQHYLTRRTQFLIKLTVVSAISRTGDIVLDEFDVERARHWLLSAEATMPNIFTAMNVKTDAQLVDEMHVLAWKVWKQTKFTPLPQAFFYDFLRDRVYSERIPKIMEMAERSGLIKSLGEGLYRPEARLDLGQSVFGKTLDPIMKN